MSTKGKKRKLKVSESAIDMLDNSANDEFGEEVVDDSDNVDECDADNNSDEDIEGDEDDEEEDEPVAKKVKSSVFLKMQRMKNMACLKKFGIKVEIVIKTTNGHMFLSYMVSRLTTCKKLFFITCSI
jgi:hypothetical protein